MNSKGFTLVEILSVLIVLGLVGVIVYPQVNKVIDKNKEKTVNEDVNGLFKAYDIYLSSIDYSEVNIKIDLSNNTVDTFKDISWIKGFIEYDGNKYILTDAYNGEYCANGEENNYTIKKGEC